MNRSEIPNSWSRLIHPSGPPSVELEVPQVLCLNRLSAYSSFRTKIELPKINKTIEIKDIFEIKKAKSALFEVLNLIENKTLETVKEPLQLPEPQPVDINRELTLQAQHNQAESVADFVESEPLQVIEPPTLPEPEQQQPEPYTVRPGQPPMSYLDEVTPRPEATATETKKPSWME